MDVAGGRTAARMWGRESACGRWRSWPRNQRKTIPEVGEFRGQFHGFGRGEGEPWK